MIVLGMLIAVATAVFVGVELAQNWGGGSHTIDGFGATLGSLTLAGIFLAGIILTAIFFLALWLAGLSGRMRRRAAVRRREETRAVREEREGLAADRDRLARELDEERARGARADYPRGNDVREPYPRESYPAAGGGGRSDYTEPGYTEPGYSERETSDYRDTAADRPVYPDDPHDTAAFGDADRSEPAARDRDR